MRHGRPLVTVFSRRCPGGNPAPPLGLISPRVVFT